MCRRVIALLLVFALVPVDVAAGQTPPALRAVRIRKNTALRFALMTPLSSATAKTGDDVSLRLTRALVVDGVTVLPVGHVTHARVKKAWPAKPCTTGLVEVELNRIRFSDSTSVKTKVFYQGYYPDVVSEIYEEKNAQDGFGYAICTAYLSVVLSPLILHEKLSHRKFRTCPKGEEHVLSTESTIGVVILKNHVVRM